MEQYIYFACDVNVGNFHGEAGMGIVAKGGMKVYTSGVYGELVLRSATTWPSGLLLVMVICSLCRTLEEMQDDAVTSGNNVFFVFFELCIWNAKWSGDDEHGCSPFRGL